MEGSELERIASAIEVLVGKETAEAYGHYLREQHENKIYRDKEGRKENHQKANLSSTVERWKKPSELGKHEKAIYKAFEFLGIDGTYSAKELYDVASLVDEKVNVYNPFSERVRRMYKEHKLIMAKDSFGYPLYKYSLNDEAKKTINLEKENGSK